MDAYLLFQVRPHGQRDHTEGGPASETSLWTNSDIICQVAMFYSNNMQTQTEIGRSPFALLTLHLSNSKVFVEPVHSCTMEHTRGEIVQPKAK